MKGWSSVSPRGPSTASSITWGVNLLTSGGIAVLPRTCFSMRLNSQMTYGFLPRSTNDLVEPFEALLACVFDCPFVGMRFSCFLPSSLHGFVADRYTWGLMKHTTFLVLLLLTVVSACSSVLRNSASFYRDHPPSTRINWHEYTE